MVGFRSRSNALFTIFIYAASMGGIGWSFPAQAQVWRCAQGYTNSPQGKTDCKLAGAMETCGSDGNRYLSPRKAGEAPNNETCVMQQPAKNPLAHMSAANAAQFGETRNLERLAGVPSTSNSQERKFSQPATVKPTTVKSPFTCSDPSGILGGCSVEDVTKFVEKTFSSISNALKR